MEHSDSFHFRQNDAVIHILLGVFLICGFVLQLLVGLLIVQSLGMAVRAAGPTLQAVEIQTEEWEDPHSAVIQGSPRAWSLSTTVDRKVYVEGDLTGYSFVVVHRALSIDGYNYDVEIKVITRGKAVAYTFKKMNFGLGSYLD